MRDSDGMELFESYLRDVKRSSQNTISSYLRDIRQLSEYLHAHTDADLGSAEEEELCEYIDWMRSNGKSVATVSRAIASLKNFYGFLLNNHYVQHNPTGKLVPDKAKQKLPQILSSKEVELLLAQPECTDAKGYRDRAMLELLYATGIRVSELISLNITDVNLSAGVIRCQGRDKARMIPMYPAAVRALTEYINFIRPQMIAAPDEQALFVNVSGERMSRLRGASAGKWRGYPRHSGNARPCGHLLDADLFAPCQQAAQGCLQQSAPACVTYVFSSAPKRLGALFLFPAVAYGAKICYIYLIGVMHMRILGVDPGIATVGFAVLDAEKRSQRLLTCGVITTPAKTQLSSRLDQIYRDLNELIAQFHPEVMAVEELFFNTNITTGIAVAHGRGIILLSGYQAWLQIYEYTPLQVKQAVVGYGRADKKQVMDMVRRILSLQAVPKPDDAADAVAIALCHARSATSLIHQQERFDPCSTT